MKERATHIKIDHAIRIVENAADQGLISRKAAETIIYEIYDAENISKYKKAYGPWFEENKTR